MRVNDEGIDTDNLLLYNKPIKAWYILKAWYKSAGDSTFKISPQYLSQITRDREKLYAYEETQGYNIECHVTPTNIPNDIPSIKEILMTMKN